MADAPAPEPRVISEPVPINGPELLEKLVALPISAWNYEFDDASIRHLGPMAQDFFATFGLGGDDKTISMVDANGVVMVAIQALYRRVVALEAELAAVKSGEADVGPAA
jgi:hypothetical protein